MGNKAKLFKSSMNGFNKDDVNKYIIDINNEFAAKEEDYKNEIKRLMARIHEANAKLDEAQLKIDSFSETEKALAASEENLLECQSRLSEAESSYNQLKESHSTLENELSLSKESIASLEEANSALRAQCADLETKLEASCENADVEEETAYDESTFSIESTSAHADDISVIEKAKLYDKLSAKVGEIIINANKSADEIIRNAEFDAARLSESSSRYAEKSCGKLKDLTDTTVTSIKKDLYTGVEACIKEFKSYSSDISNVSKNMISDLEKKYSSLSTRIEYLGSTIEKRMAGKLRDFNGKCNAISNDVKKGLDN